MSYRYELNIIITYALILSITSIIFASANAQGVFGSIADVGDPQNFTITNTNTSIAASTEVLVPPTCQSVIDGVAIPIVDDIGCMGATLTWLNGLRNIQGTNIWFLILFGLPVAIAVFSMTIRTLRGN